MLNNLKDKKIDVVIPVYNGEKFIIDAIESVTKQSYSPIKIIVVDDGSTDNTFSLVSEYAKNSKIEIRIVQKKNGGLSSARNAGIKESDSEFIAFLDADDIWLPEKLKKQIETYNLSEFTNLALVYCDYNVIDNEGKFLYKNYKSPLDHKRMRGKVFEKLLERNQITGSGSGVLIKREVFEKVGLFDESLKFGEDWDMWLRIAQKFEVDFSSNSLVQIRKHGKNMTSNPSSIFERELGFYKKWMSLISRQYPTPLFWSDKITFRIISGFPKYNLLSVLKKTFSKEEYKNLFRKSFGLFGLYIPIFLIRQIFNAILKPNNMKIIVGLVKHGGK